MGVAVRTAVLVAVVACACIAAVAAAGAAAGPHAAHGAEGQDGGGVPSKAVDNSIPYVGGGGRGMIGYGGGGVTVGVIDTGVDVFHPDFADGRGGSRIVKSHNLLGPGPALDRDGHGTGVAGIIAAGGALQGMAPLAEIISYRVSGDGLSVAPDMIVDAVDRAVVDEVDVVNISLGVNRTNERIDSAINRAVAGGTVVVAAAGNDGPAGGSIGSPGRNPNVITVGATYNNVTSGLVATVEAGGWGAYEAVPMVGAPVPESPIQGAVAFAGYAREGDIERAGPVDGAIVLAERGGGGGGEGEGEGGDLVYFSDKERNAAGGGAAALVVYNNEQGIFFGELVHENTPDGYEPRIPTVSMSRDDGIRLREALEANGTITAVLSVRESPDFVAEFSSRGPVSPFYTKPDILAPGVFINTTLNGGGYNMTSGTSFAAPHVAGAAALVLEKWPGLPPAGVKSILVTTADPVSGLQKGRVREGGDGRAAESTAGRLNVTRALAAETVFAPPLAGIDLSPARPLGEAVITARSLAGGPVGPLAASIDVPAAVDASYEVAPAPGGAATVTVRARAGGGDGGGAGPWHAGGPRVLHGSLSISDGHAEYTVPVIVRAANGTIRASEVPRGSGGSWPLGGGAAGSAVEAVVEAPAGWTYARITVTDARTGEQYVTSSRPGEPGTVGVSGNGTHWVRAVIRSGGAVAEAYGEVDVRAAVQDSGALQGAILLPSIPERQAAIVAAATALVAAAGIAIAARARRAARAARAAAPQARSGARRQGPPLGEQQEYPRGDGHVAARLAQGALRDDDSRPGPGLDFKAAHAP